MTTPFKLFTFFFALLLAFASNKVSTQETRPIFMDRREAAPFGEILTELKGKGLGGRMRFGKRSGYGNSLGVYRSIYNSPEYLQI